MSTILFKLRQRTSKTSTIELLAVIQMQCKVQAELLFPDTTQRSLKHLFSVEVPDTMDAKLLSTLTGMKMVLYAEIAPQRQLAQ